MKIAGKFVKIREKQKGLSLIEMTIAIAILVVALLSALILATLGLMAGEESEMRIVAINLAREGVEVVRNTRDSNWLKCGEACWLEGDAGPKDNILLRNSVPVFDVDLTDKIWRLQSVTGFDPSDPSSAGGSDTNIVLNPTYGLYLQKKTGDSTNFYRFIKVDDETVDSRLGDDEIRVTSYVAYQERGRWHLVNVEDHLFNWY